MANADSNTIPGFATFGFVVFLALAGTGAFAHFNQQDWRAGEDAREAALSEAAAQAELSALAAEQFEAAAMAEAEAKVAADARQVRIDSCTSRSAEVADAEAMEFAKLLDYYGGSCAGSYKWLAFDPIQSRMLRLHDRQRALKSECLEHVTLGDSLNGRTREDVSGWQCRSLDSLVAQGRPPAVQEASRQPALDGWGLNPDAAAPPDQAPPAGDGGGAETRAAPPVAGDIAWADFVWRRTPSAADFERAAPDRAKPSDYPADVILSCIVDPKGDLDCEVLSAAPGGKGFDKAALRISREFRAEPLTVDGRNTAGAKTKLHLAFEAPE